MPKKNSKKVKKTTKKTSSKAVEAEIVDDAAIPEGNLPSVDIVSPIEEMGLVPSDPLVQYLNEIKKYPLLTPEEEKKLALKYYEKGDALAAEKLVTSNLRFVVKIALEYARMGAKLMDLIQEGNVGLMHAVKEYNPYKGVKLITYAVWWIRGYMREYLLKQYSMVKIGTTQNQKKLFYNLKNEQERLKSIGEEPTDVKLLSSRLGVREKDVELMQQRMSAKDSSLDAPLDEDGTSHLLDLQTTYENPESELEVLELVEILKDRIEELKPKLNEKEIDILENRILADEPQTLQEIGDKYGITRERARQLEERLLKYIKDSFLESTHEKITKKVTQESKN